MKTPFRLGIAVVAVGVACWTTPLTHAHADIGPISDAILLNGQANITGDNVGGCGDPQDPALPVGVDGHPSVDLLNGCGTFSFASTTCVGFSADDGLPAACTVTSNGDFVNSVCGTGMANGSANVNSGPDTGSIITFAITFRAGIGVLTGSVAGSPPDADSIVGFVLLRPVGVPADGRPDCADGFGIIAGGVALS